MEVFGKELVGLLSIVELIIVRARITVFMPAECRFCAVKLEKRFDLLVDVRLDQVGPKATVIFGVVNQQRRARRTQRDEEGIILVYRKVAWALLHLVGILRTDEVGLLRPEPCHLHRHGDTFVERAKKKSLPATSGEACHP